MSLIGEAELSPDLPAAAPPHGSPGAELALGESCDDGNFMNGDGCDASCHVEPFATTPPVKISGTLGCDTAFPERARMIAIDGSGTIYAVMTCAGIAEVVVSTDRGVSFSDPLDLSTELASTPVLQVAVATGPSGVAYVAMVLSNNQVFLRTTQNRGATWNAAIPIGTATDGTVGLSLQSFNDAVYIGFKSSNGLSVARNYNRGTGAFATTPVVMDGTFFDLEFDIKLGTLAVCTGTPGFHVRVSSDAGVSFAAEVNPPGQQSRPDWASGNGRIFVSGNAGFSRSLFVIPTNAPSTSSNVMGLPLLSLAQHRTLAADAAGNAFIASERNGGVQLDRLAAGATTFDMFRTIDAQGSLPSVAALPGNAGAAVVYTRGGTGGTEVWATVQAY